MENEKEYISPSFMFIEVDLRDVICASDVEQYATDVDYTQPVTDGTTPGDWW